MSKNNITQIVLLLAVCVLSSCSLFSPFGVGGGRNLTQSFFMGGDTIMYFIKPLEFSEVKGDDLLLMDFTIKQSKNIDKYNKSRVNYSFKSKKPFKNIDSIVINNDNIRYKFDNSSIMFIDKDKDVFISRYGSNVETRHLISLFKNNKWNIKVYEKNTNYLFTPTKRTAKAIEYINDNIFILFEE